MAGFNEHLKVYNEWYCNNQAVPVNTTINTNVLALGSGGQAGSIEVIVQVNTTVTLANGRTMTVKLQEEVTTGTWADRLTLFTVLTTGATTYTPDTILGGGILPTDIKKNTRCVITTNDGAASGTINIFPDYVPR